MVDEVIAQNKMTQMINRRATATELKIFARAHGMLTMQEDGLIKAKLGVTSLNEVLRVANE